MTRLCLMPLILLALLVPSGAQDSTGWDRGFPHRDKADADERLPNGKLQRDAILKAEYERSIKDAQQLVDLSQALQKELQDSGAQVLSISSLRKAEEIEKLAKKIRTRIAR